MDRQTDTAKMLPADIILHTSQPLHTEKQSGQNMTTKTHYSCS